MANGGNNILDPNYVPDRKRIEDLEKRVAELENITLRIVALTDKISDIIGKFVAVQTEVNKKLGNGWVTPEENVRRSRHY